MEGIIHVAGVMPRIGATTLCMQLLAFIRENGYECAYVEMNGQQYIWACEGLYSGCKKDKKNGRTVYGGIDMYGAGSFGELASGGSGYDFLVCDYGNLLSGDFDRANFLNCSAYVLVAGTKPNEIFHSQKAVSDPGLGDAVYVFNFTLPGERNDILDMMEERSESTAFLPYCPDPFDGTSALTEEGSDCLGTVMGNVMYRIRGR